MMFVIAIYLIRIGGVYSVGPLHDFSWNILATATAVAYHYWLLLPIAFVSVKKINNYYLAVCYLTFIKLYIFFFYQQHMKINLNYLLCPAVVDPFGHETHRIAAIVYQGVFGALLGKMICLICDFIFTQHSNTKIKSSLDAPLVYSKKNY